MITEKGFVDAMLWAIAGPIITWPECEDTVTDEMKSKIKTERLLQLAHEPDVEMATDYETMVYISSATFVNVPSETWFKVYMHLFKKFYPNAEGFEEIQLDSWQTSQLNDLKRWLWKKAQEHLKEKMKETHKTREEEQPKIITIDNFMLQK